MEVVLIALGVLSTVYFASLHPAIGLGYLLAIPVFLGIGFMHGVDRTAVALAVVIVAWALVVLVGISTIWLIGGLIDPWLVVDMVAGFTAMTGFYLAGWIEGYASGLRYVDLDDESDDSGGDVKPVKGLIANLLERFKPERRVELV